jgi:type I restriction enzyme, S subunit
MEVRPGYKRTEVGFIPQDWQDVLLDRVAKRGSGHTPDKKHPEYWNGDIKWISLADSAALDQVFIDDTISKITPEGLAHSSAVLHPAGTVVLSRDAGIGKSAIIRTEMAVSQHFMAWRCGPELDRHFLYYWLQAAKPQFERIANGTTIKTIGLQYFKDLKIPLPPHREQHAIAAALSDVDALLGGLNRVIAKKRDLKRAVMQQLLSGQTRLPGFHGEWEVASLDMLTTRATGVWGRNEPDERNTRLVEIIRAGDISQDGRLTATATRHVAPQEFEKAKCTLDDLVITTSGNGLGKVWWCDGRSNIAASNFVRVLHPNAEKVVGKFLYYALRTEEGLRQLQEHTATSAYPNLRPTYFSTAWIPLPLPPEQNAIAAVLADMDTVLSALDARRDKTRALKQGMMQELLTGRTRLV